VSGLAISASPRLATRLAVEFDAYSRC